MLYLYAQQFSAAREVFVPSLLSSLLDNSEVLTIPGPEDIVAGDDPGVVDEEGDVADLLLDLLAHGVHVLAVAQVGAAINTLASSFMLMTGREGTFGRITLIALIANVGLNLWLIPSMGGAGAAIATLCSIWLLAAFQLWSCLRIIRSGEFKDKPR